MIEAIGARHARRYFLTAERFEAAEAYRLGLVHDIVPIMQLDDRINEVLGTLLIVGMAYLIGGRTPIDFGYKVSKGGGLNAQSLFMQGNFRF